MKNWRGQNDRESKPRGGVGEHGMVLTGSGVISMGRVASRGTPLAIEYSVES